MGMRDSINQAAAAGAAEARRESEAQRRIMLSHAAQRAKILAELEERQQARRRQAKDA